MVLILNMTKNFKKITKHSTLLKYLVIKDFKGKYKTLSLGAIWALLNPLLMMAVYMIVFAYLLKFKIPNYAMFLLAGIIPWSFLQSGWGNGTTSILDNAELIKKSNFPREILVMASIISNAIDFLVSFIMLFIFMIIFKIQPTWYLLFIPLIIILQFFFILGLSLITSALQIKFRDTRYILDVLLRIGFYVTPIIYSIQMVPERFHRLYLLNPMVGFTMLYRKTILNQEAFLISRNVVLYTIAFTMIALLVGYFIFKKYKKNFADYV